MQNRLLTYSYVFFIYRKTKINGKKIAIEKLSKYQDSIFLLLMSSNTYILQYVIYLRYFTNRDGCIHQIPNVTYINIK